MTPREIRMRCIEAVASTGVREPSRLVKDAKMLEEYVMDAPDVQNRTNRATKDKASAPG